MRKKIFAGLVGLIGTALIAGACNVKFDSKGKTITPEGEAITETRDIGTFDRIDVEDAFAIHYKAGIPTDGLTIKAAPNLMEYIVTEVANGELSIRLKDRYSIHDGKIVVTVGSPTLKAVEMSGACSLNVEGELVGDRLDLDMSGASSLNLTGRFRVLDIDASGASGITLKGSCEELKLSCSGAIGCDASEFITQRTEVSISGTASVKINASESVRGNLSGVSSLENYGASSNDEVVTSGMSSYKHK